MISIHWSWNIPETISTPLEYAAPATQRVDRLLKHSHLQSLPTSSSWAMRSKLGVLPKDSSGVTGIQTQNLRRCTKPLTPVLTQPQSKTYIDQFLHFCYFQRHCNKLQLDSGIDYRKLGKLLFLNNILLLSRQVIAKLMYEWKNHHLT